MITLTDSAKDKIVNILFDETNRNLKFRAFVKGGGCSGFEYGFILDEEQGEDDFEIDIAPFKLLVDAASMQYLQEATIDYKEELMGSNFIIDNPNSKSTCGCGSSFSV